MAKIDSYFRSDIGRKRSNNEDFSGAFEPSKREPLNQSGRLYVVADGMGGHEQGEKASSYAVETLLKVYYEAPEIPPEKRLRDIVKKINQNLIAYAEKNLSPGEKTGTTLVAAVVRRGNLLVANIGDSRAYLLREGKIQQVSRDHSFVGELVRAGTMTEAEARQSKYRNRLSRSVGADPKLEVDVYPAIPLRSGDIILLCSDGLTQYASPEDILDAAHGNAQEIVERLIRFANDRGGSDNITVGVIRYGEKTSALLPVRKLVILGLGILAVSVFALIAWFGSYRWGALLATPTSTVSTASTASPIPATFSSSATPTILPTDTLTLVAEQTGTPTVSPPPMLTESPGPAIASGLVECEYTVLAGDYAGKIATAFNTTLDQVFRLDGTQENMGAISPGEILVIRNISTEACTNGGGVTRSVPAVAP